MRPIVLTVAAVVEGLEGAVLVSLAAYVAVVTATRSPASISTAVALAATTLALGLGAFLVCRGLYQVKRWSRTPALITQICVLPVAGSLLRNGWVWAGVALMLTAVVTCGMLLHPAVTELLGRYGSTETRPGPRS